jgi:hypothetical protein
MFAQTARM